MARQRQQEETTELSGQDSFLDMIANIVGILILLVVIVGIRAALEVVPELELEPTDVVVLNEATATREEANVKKLLEQAVSDKLRAAAIEVRADELDNARVAVLSHVDEVEQELEHRRNQLSESDRKELDLKVAINQAQYELSELAGKHLAMVSDVSRSKTVLRNVPTPISRAVDFETEEEIHFRISSERVTYVPLNELFEMVEERQRTRGRVSSDVIVTSPYRGYRAHYAIMKVTRSTPVGPVSHGFFFVEIRSEDEKQGESVEHALGDDSGVMAELKQYEKLAPRPTVTIWAYPDSFQQASELRTKVAEKGFGTAIRPLLAGQHIGISPLGNKTRAQ